VTTCEDQVGGSLGSRLGLRTLVFWIVSFLGLGDWGAQAEACAIGSGGKLGEEEAGLKDQRYMEAGREEEKE
jgi:hypothetical protein